jgi:PAS domain S-box-containing protein
MQRRTSPRRKRTNAVIEREVVELRARLDEAEQTLAAIRAGHVDAVVIDTPEGDKIFTLTGADHRYRRLVETMNEGAATLSPEGTVLYSNRRLAEMVGRPLERMIGVTLSDCVAPESKATLDAVLRRADDHVGKAEIELLRQDGGRVPVYVSATRNAEDEIGGVALLATDLTEQKKSEEMVKAERLAASILDQAAEAIVVCDPKGRIIRASDTTHQLLGENPLLRTFPEMFPMRLVKPNGHSTTMELLGAALRGEVISGVEVVLDRMSGEATNLLMSAGPLTDAGAEVLGCVVSLTDITAQKRAEAAIAFLAEVTAELGASLEYATTLQKLTGLVVPVLADWCAIYTHETDGALPELAAVTHVKASKAVLIHEEARHFARRDASSGYAHVLATGQATMVPRVTEADLRALAQDDAHYRLLLAIRPRSVIIVPLVVQRRVFGAMVFGRSETDEVYDHADLALREELARHASIAIDNAKLYEIAQRERARVEHANQAKDVFLATVSHELRTPLNAMLGWTRLLRSGALAPDKFQRGLETIERNAVAQAQLIEDLLDISRIISGKLRLEVRAVDLLKVVEAAVDVVRPTADARGVRLEVNLCRDAMVAGDPDRLQQVIWNLLSNGIKFTPRGGVVKVRQAVHGGNVRLQVIDSGEGIPREFLPHVFDQFRQADGSPTRAHGGLGLGLSIVRHLVELHGGSIRAASDGAGKGATFTVDLPAGAARHAGERATPVQSSASVPIECAPHLEGLHVLVVDDEESACELLVTVLEQCKMIVTCARSAAAGFDAFTRLRPDALVSDIGMPREDGYTLIRRIRALPAEAGGRLPAVALTAYARIEDRMQALTAGFTMHVAKPVEPAELIAVLGTLTASRIEAPR